MSLLDAEKGPRMSIAEPSAARSGKGDLSFVRRTGLARVLDSFALPLYILDIEGRIQYMNHEAIAASVAAGATPEALLGVRAQDFGSGRISLNPADYPRRSMQAVDGAALATTLNLLLDDKGNPVGFTYAWEDRTRAEYIRSASQETASQVIALTERLETVTGQLGAQASGTADGAQTTAAAVEQMSASVQEIATSATRAVEIANQAVSAASEATGRVSKLDSSSQEISVVVKLITQIADQTNLLALNATIEAARAGEAGKGFAVVASEVKELARETAEATKRITDMIAGLQDDSLHVTTALNAITELIDQISGAQSAIASAVEEQSATTSEISRSVGGVAETAELTSRDVETIAQGIAEVSDASRVLEALTTS